MRAPNTEGRPRLLDLFCGAGGAAMGYHRAGFDVVGVDIKPQPRYPFEFIQADAMTFPLDGYDAIHASPPCQRFSRKTRDREKHPDLVTPTIQRLEEWSGRYVIENVPGSPLWASITLCGSAFGLRVRRHRLFQANFCLWPRPCSHAWQDVDPKFTLYDHGRTFTSGIVHVFGSGGGKGKEFWAEAMGIDWMTKEELTQAIPPAYTEYIGKQLLEHGG